MPVLQLREPIWARACHLSIRTTRSVLHKRKRTPMSKRAHRTQRYALCTGEVGTPDWRSTPWQDCWSMCTGEVGTPDWRSKPWQDCYVYRCHSIWILTHILEIRTHIFNAIEIVDGHLAHQRNQIGKVQNAKLCLPNHIPVRDADWFTCHFRQLYFKTDWSEIHFLYTLSFPFYAFVFASAENSEEALGSKVWWKY